MTDETLTPKQQYEVRKAERKRLRAEGYRSDNADQLVLEVMDIFDRLTTAVERIANALEKPDG